MRRPRRGLLALLALAVTVVQLFGLGHLVFVTHAICEHGDLLHAESAARHAEEARANDTADAADATDTPRAERGRGAEDHQHCDALAVRPAVVAVQAAFDAPAEHETTIPPALPAAGCAHAPIALLSLAPKSSPPVRAARSQRAPADPMT